MNKRIRRMHTIPFGVCRKRKRWIVYLIQGTLLQCQCNLVAAVSSRSRYVGLSGCKPIRDCMFSLLFGCAFGCAWSWYDSSDAWVSRTSRQNDFMIQPYCKVWKHLSSTAFGEALKSSTYTRESRIDHHRLCHPSMFFVILSLTYMRIQMPLHEGRR